MSQAGTLGQSPVINAFLIPTIQAAQTFKVQLGGTVYTFTLIYRNDPGGEGGWVLDIGDSLNNPILRGVPLVTGADLLAQYEYLGLAGQLYVVTPANPGHTPAFDDLGVNTQLYWVPNTATG